ncbi:MAG: transporter substrate-binding domain-containing protein [Magnetococcales bacterium]|nr:transporter substrate-binding domain-containing protein [Magnetococcales bacterium]
MLNRLLVSVVVGLMIGLSSGIGQTEVVDLPGAEKQKSDQSGATAQTDKNSRTVLVAAPWTVFTKVKRGAPVGVLAETTDIILKRMGFNPVFVGMSMGEIPKAMKENQVAASALMVKNPDNEKNVLLTEPIVNEYTAVVVRRGESFSLERLSDLRGRKIGGRQGYRYPLLEEDDEIKIQRFRSDGEVMRSLLLHKVDIVLVSALSNVYSFRVEGVINKLEVLPVTVGIVPLRVALSPKVFTPADQTRFNSLIEQVRNEPVWQEILAKNGFADLIHDFPLLKK